MVNLPYVALHDYCQTKPAAAIVYTLDLSGHFKFVNAAGQRLLGYSGEELSRMTVREIVCPELADLVSEQIRSLVEQPVGVVYEIEIINRNRRRVRLETSFHAAIGNRGQIELHGIALPPMGREWQTPARCLAPNFINDLIGPRANEGVSRDRNR